VLGQFRLVKAGCPVPVRAGGKTQVLLSALALGPPHGVSRRNLLNVLWPASEPPLAAQSLNSLVHHLQQMLGAELGGEQLLLRENGCYRLNHDAGVAVDAARFVALAGAGDLRAAGGDVEGAVHHYRRATELYQGDLGDAEDVQAVVERERLRVLYLTLLARVADHYFATGDYAACQQYAQRSLTCEPCREDAHRILMRCYARRGERAQALRQYRLCEQILSAEFGAVPEPATNALFDLARRDPGSL
jgi:DNA-binding SARP family transcriptional activator